MAKARMLHKKISISLQVNKLSLPAKLLFTWMIPHADDEGRLRGELEYIKATVVPMLKWSFSKIEAYISDIEKQGLIYFWDDGANQYIEFVKWDEHQQIRKDRFKPSSLPSYSNNNDNPLTTSGIPVVVNNDTEYNISEYNSIKLNKSETNKYKTIADKKETAFKKKSNSVGAIVNPKTFSPSNELETAAYEAWNSLEPANPLALKTTYLWAAKRGLPANLFYVYVSEIKEDKTIENRGAVFRSKVENYLKNKANKS